MRITYIYILIDPITNQVRYVGKSNNPKIRLAAHWNKARFKNTHKFNWISKLKISGVKPELVVIDEVKIEEWRYWEKYWIGQFTLWGFNLTNTLGGGEGLTFGNKTSFKKGEKPWNTGTRNIEKCCVCGKEYYEYKSNVRRGRCCCSRECAKVKRSGHESTQFKKGHKPKNRKEVYQYSKDRRNFIDKYESVKDAAVTLKINEIAIANCCRGVTKSSGGYFWSYKTIKYEK